METFSRICARSILIASFSFKIFITSSACGENETQCLSNLFTDKCKQGSFLCFHVHFVMGRQTQKLIETFFITMGNKKTRKTGDSHMTQILSHETSTWFAPGWSAIPTSDILGVKQQSEQHTCCFVLRVGLTEMWTSFMALSIKVTVYGLFVSGFTHLSATIVAMSRNIISCWFCLSFSDTCSSPLARI